MHQKLNWTHSYSFLFASDITIKNCLCCLSPPPSPKLHIVLDFRCLRFPFLKDLPLLLNINCLLFCFFCLLPFKMKLLFLNDINIITYLPYPCIHIYTHTYKTTITILLNKTAEWSLSLCVSFCLHVVSHEGCTNKVPCFKWTGHNSSLWLCVDVYSTRPLWVDNGIFPVFCYYKKFPVNIHYASANGSLA